MLILLKKNATPEQVDHICERVRQVGLAPGVVPGVQRTAITVTGNTGVAVIPDIEALPGVLRVLRVSKPYRKASLEATDGQPTLVPVGDAFVGGNDTWFVAGPCSVDEPDRLDMIAAHLKALGVHALRGGAWKPRTNPYAFQGHGLRGLQLLAEAGRRHGLPIVSEAMDEEGLLLVEEYADVIQIGARNMQNYSLLKKAGLARKPILLKRGLSATVDELLDAAEYILAAGNPHVILCERGIRTFCDHSRFTLDVAAIPILKATTHLPIIVDPSHPAGVRPLVEPLARAGIAAGADGLIVEVHPEPEKSLSDADQALRFHDIDELVRSCRGIAAVLGRGFGRPT